MNCDKTVATTQTCRACGQMHSDYREMVIAMRSYLEYAGIPRPDVDNIVDGMLNDMDEAIEELGAVL